MSDLKFVVDADLDEQEICARFEREGIIEEIDDVGDCYFSIKSSRDEIHKMLDLYLDHIERSLNLVLIESYDALNRTFRIKCLKETWQVVEDFDEANISIELIEHDSPYSAVSQVVKLSDEAKSFIFGEE